VHQSHFGGQTPLKLAKGLTAIGANIAGTTAKVIDLAEDRELFSTFIEDLRLQATCPMVTVFH